MIYCAASLGLQRDTVVILQKKAKKTSIDAFGLRFHFNIMNKASWLASFAQSIYISACKNKYYLADIPFHSMQCTGT